MARVSWKYLYITNNDLKQFYAKINTQNYLSDTSRNKTINLLNAEGVCSTYQGNVEVTTTLNTAMVGKKLGMFSKTRKPFFFRSKKKKK